MFTYSFANVDLIITGLKFPGSKAPSSMTVKGFPSGEGQILASRREPVANTTFGAYGDMVVSMQRIKAGDVVFPLLAQSPENEHLQNWINWFQEQAQGQDGKEVEGLGVTITDAMGNDSVVAKEGVILANPTFSRGQTSGTNTWILTFQELIIKRGVGRDDKK